MKPHATGPAAGPFQDLDDAEWELVAPLLADAPCTQPRRGRPAAAPRALVNAALWRLAGGAGWVSLPLHYPAPSTCRRHYEQWLADGTWAALAERLQRAGRTLPLPAPAPAAPARATFCSILMG
jgi:transposase